ncbi:hypothetical protein Ate01nite_34080 [Actinoplanes teichomyceticus]|uniref:nSTAND1 domain-containing NTPase n=1 Tax=Actinoplanes teichomyceticus TaxID=1867 RepID=UPI0019417184|nr:hypothetical protein [Actinoplanes teichomyceticus]GIF13376.1 hypothetical protein Ate01nite_34080 [Actinoplanes teichomyceticus]
MDADHPAEDRGSPDPVSAFASRLRRLQADSGGPSVRDLERLTAKVAMPYTRTTIQDKLTGRSAVSWEFVEAFVRACALHTGTRAEVDLRPWRAWHAEMTRDLTAQRAGRRRSVKADVCPYRGLEVFCAEHAEWFHGRTAAVQHVLAALAGHQQGVLLLGPSGAGKSSLIQAGVVPALGAGRLPGSDRWLIVVARPGKDLLGEMARAGLPEVRDEPIAAAVASRLADQPDTARLLLIIDQFEELLTPPRSAAETDWDGHHAGRRDDAQRQGIEQLTAAIGTPGLSVVLVVRDDFYPRLASQAPALLDRLTAGLINVPALLSAHDLQDIITKPAQAVGLAYQDGLPERIVSDVLAANPDAAPALHAPVTVLPLLELALQQLWQRRQGSTLTHEAYQRLGGLTGAVATWCGAAVAQLPAVQRSVAQQILIALVRPADETHHIPAMRQQAPLAALRELARPIGAGGGESAPEMVDEVLAVLTGQRIVTTRIVGAAQPDQQPGVDGVVPVAELVHDAVIRDWTTLRHWVAQDQRFQDWLRRAEERHVRWSDHHDPDDLLHGSDLAEGVSWSAHRPLPHDIAAFLQTSRRHQQARIRRARRLNAVLAGLLAIALMAAGVATWQRRTAVAAQQVALSRQLAAQSAVLLPTNSELADLLAVQAYRISPTEEAVASLYSAVSQPVVRALTGHTDTVSEVTYSPDRRHLATAGHDRTVRVWDLDTGGSRTLSGHSDAVSAVSYRPDGRQLASAGRDRSVRIWELDTGASRALTGHTGEVSAVAYHPDGRQVASAGRDKTVRLWDLGTGTSRTLTGHTDGVSAVAYSPDGRHLATAGHDRTVRLWDLGTGKPRTLTGHTDAILTVAYSPDGRHLASAGRDRTVRAWNVDAGTSRALTGHTNWVFTVAYSPDGRQVASAGGDETVRLWDLDTTQSRTLSGHTDAASAVAYSADGRHLASAGRDRTVRAWDLDTGTSRTLTGHTDAVFAVAYRPDGHQLASTGRDGTVRVWDLDTGATRTLTGHTGAAYTVVYSPDGRQVATAGRDRTVRLWDLDTGTSRALTGHTDRASAAAYRPDGHQLASGGRDRTVRLWDLDTGTTRTLTGHTDGVSAVTYRPDGHQLASAGRDKTVRLWDLDTGTTRTLTGHTAEVFTVAYSPDRRHLATAGRDKTVRVWDLETGAYRTLTGHTDAVAEVTYSPDGHHLASASWDGTVRVWANVGLTLTAAIDLICRNLGRDLTPAERGTYLPSAGSAPPACPAPDG